MTDCLCRLEVAAPPGSWWEPGGAVAGSDDTAGAAVLLGPRLGAGQLPQPLLTVRRAALAAAVTRALNPR